MWHDSPPGCLHAKPHVQLTPPTKNTPALHVTVKKERGLPLNVWIKRRLCWVVRLRGEQGGRGMRGKKTDMGKSIWVCEKWCEWRAFPHWSSKGYFTPKSLYWLHAFGAVSWRESGGISAGGIYTVFIFCIRIRVGVGDDQCSFNVAAGSETWIIGSRAITFYLALSLVGLRDPEILQFTQHMELDFLVSLNVGAKRIWLQCGTSITGTGCARIMAKYTTSREEYSCSGEYLVPV